MCRIRLQRLPNSGFRTLEAGPCKLPFPELGARPITKSESGLNRQKRPCTHLPPAEAFFGRLAVWLGRRWLDMPIGSSCEFQGVLSAAVAPEVASLWYPMAGHPIVVNTTVGSSCRVAASRNGTKSQVLVAWSKLPQWLWFLGGVDLVLGPPDMVECWKCSATNPPSFRSEEVDPLGCARCVLHNVVFQGDAAWVGGLGESYSGTWKSVNMWNQTKNCMGRRAFRKSNKSTQPGLKHHGTHYVEVLFLDPWQSLSLSFSFFISPSIYLSISLSIYVSVYLSIYPSMYLSDWQRSYFCVWHHPKRRNSARLPAKMGGWVQSWRFRANAFCDFPTPPF